MTDSTAPRTSERERIVEKHVRHVKASPGVGEDAQRYALAVLDDVLSDLAALRESEQGVRVEGWAEEGVNDDTELCGDSWREWVVAEHAGPAPDGTVPATLILHDSPTPTEGGDSDSRRVRADVTTEGSAEPKNRSQSDSVKAGEQGQTTTGGNRESDLDSHAVPAGPSAGRTDDEAVHRRHCSPDGCKYGEGDCPAGGTDVGERLYPCATPGCEVMRTKAEGGTTFTICEDCWPIHGPGARLTAGSSPVGEGEDDERLDLYRWMVEEQTRSHKALHDYFQHECGDEPEWVPGEMWSVGVLRLLRRLRTRPEAHEGAPVSGEPLGWDVVQHHDDGTHSSLLDHETFYTDFDKATERALHEMSMDNLIVARVEPVGEGSAPAESEALTFTKLIASTHNLGCVCGGCFGCLARAALRSSSTGDPE